MFDLQTDLKAMGFLFDTPDGWFGGKTRDALIDFQEAAATTDRKTAAGIVTVSPTFTGSQTGICDAPTRAELLIWKNAGYSAAPATPPVWFGPEAPAQAADVPFAPLPPAGAFWPVRTRLTEGRLVSFKGASGTIYGSRGRRFLADRDNGRFHVGVDLYGEHLDLIVACEAGTIVDEYYFYNGTNALFVQCDSGVVINYGEIEPKSMAEFGHTIGSKVAAGEPLARVGKMEVDSMCHFEMYTTGTKSNKKYYAGKPRPVELLNPTQYLLELAKRGK